jgi:5' nucleotidase, deoxy (Pyrimidine), cytosolic type C protein (NT5C)
MRFGIDLDGVLADFGGRVVEIGNKLWPGKFPPGYVLNNWNYEGYLNGEEWAQVWAAIKATPNFWIDESNMPGVDDLQNYLALQPNDEVFFITARATTIGAGPLPQSCAWLNARGLYPRGGYSVVLPVADASDKKQLFRGLGIQYMLDDYAPTVEQLNSIEKMGKFEMCAFVLDQPWNRYASNLPRVYSVQEYLNVIHQIERYRCNKPPVNV